MPPSDDPSPELLSWGQRRARWVLVATVLGSALTFIDTTVVSIALPAVGADLGAGSTGLTWVVNGYTLTLAALVLLGGSLGDRYGRRRIFLLGVACFAGASALCGLAPDVTVLVAARAVQGIGGALLVPTALAILQSSFAPGHRARAIGAWSGFTGVASAVGPFAGGWLVQTTSWRWVFLVNLPVALAVVLIARRHVPESRDPGACPQLDVPGAALLVTGLGALTLGLTAAAGDGRSLPATGGALAAGAGLLAAFLLRERRAAAPLLPPALLGQRLFVAANLITFVVYAGLGAVFFVLVVALQVGAGFPPVAAGLSLLPVTVLMLLLSPSAGALAHRTGPRLPMTAGPLIAALGVLLLGRAGPGAHYLLEVLLPAAVFGAGLTLLVTPLTATVLGALPTEQAGLASGVNNAVARTAGLLAVAAIPLVGGLGETGLTDPARVREGFPVVMGVCAGLLAAGGLLSAAVLRPTARDRP
ncbi:MULTISPECIES: MFS transporter [Kocuria]|uniref:MFS transporter n=1 Tax=Kocuria rosea subsp. polaris TaxID=136273 RepID=A0A0W8IP06_KOCRO|nr:MFS transporter [Kocuria polaris]KUG61641.1 MFS transporter [Kocuria polaris]